MPDTPDHQHVPARLMFVEAVCHTLLEAHLAAMPADQRAAFNEKIAARIKTISISQSQGANAAEKIAFQNFEAAALRLAQAAINDLVKGLG